MKRYAALLWLLLPVCRSAIAAPVVSHTMTFSMGKVTVGQAKTPGGTFATISYDDLGTIETPGAPAIPVQYINLIVPPDIDYSSVTVTSVATKPIAIKPSILYPVQLPIPTREGEGEPLPFVEPDRHIYSQEGPYPSTVVAYVREGYYDGNKHIITLAVYPVQYSPLSGKAELCTSISFSLSPNSSAPLHMHSITRNPAYEQATYDDALVQLVENAKDITTFYPGGGPVTPMGMTWNLPFYEYVVITTPDLIPAFEELVGWKRRKGINAGIISINDIYADPGAASGDVVSNIIDDAGKLRQYLADAYLNGLTYAVIGGDSTIMPLRHGAGFDNSYTYSTPDDARIPGDQYFTDFNGNWNVDGADPDLVVRYGEPTQDYVDFGPEIFVGRILCHTERDVENMVHKIIQYERNPGRGNYNYLTRAFFSQADECQAGNEAGVVSAQLPFMTTTTWQEIPSAYDPNPTFPTGPQFISQMTNNYGLVSVFAHGSPNNQAIRASNYNGCGSTQKEKVVCLDDFLSFCTPVQTGDAFDNLDDFNFRLHDYHNYPNVFYSIGCETTPLDTWLKAGLFADLSEVYTKYSRSGGIYFGNSRYGWVYSSAQLYKQFAIKIASGTYHLGMANSLSKVAFGGGWMGHWLNKAMNEIGCPETEMWTGTPATFSPVISGSGGTITVNAAVAGADICVLSTYDNGQSYFQRASGVTSYTFTGVPAHYAVCIRKHNYIPYLYQTNEPIQNQVISGTAYIGANNISAGQSVDITQPTGPVKVTSTGNVIFHAEGNIILDKGFEVEQGGFFEAR